MKRIDLYFFVNVSVHFFFPTQIEDVINWHKMFKSNIKSQKTSIEISIRFNNRKKIYTLNSRWCHPRFCIYWSVSRQRGAGWKLEEDVMKSRVTGWWKLEIKAFVSSPPVDVFSCAGPGAASRAQTRWLYCGNELSALSRRCYKKICHCQTSTQKHGRFSARVHRRIDSGPCEFGRGKKWRKK